MWENDQLRREFTNNIVSLTRWPIAEFNISSLWRAKIIDWESPSKVDLARPNSYTNLTVHREASNSTASTDEGKGIFSDKEVITSRAEFWITTPIPASLVSSNIAPSKFVLYILNGGEFHFGLAHGGLLRPVLHPFLYVKRYWWASSAILFNGRTGSLRRALFLLHQMD